MTANVNPDTGIAYGVISGKSVPYVLDDIITRGKDLTQEAAEEELRNNIRASLADFDAEQFRSELAPGADVAEAYEEHWVGVAKDDWDISDRTCKRIASEIVSLSDMESLTFDIKECEDAAFDFAMDDGALDGIDEREYEHSDGGVDYLVGYLGGAALIWVSKSPYVTYSKQCSPCVPNAGDLDNPTSEDEGRTLCYCLAPEDYPKNKDEGDMDCVPYVIRAINADGTVGDVVFERSADG